MSLQEDKGYGRTKVVAISYTSKISGMVVDPKNFPIPDLHQILVSAVAPRPIAFVSTVDAHGSVNLAPYSFFNVFSSNPPIAVFSSNRRVGDHSTKDTLHNVEQTKECVINVVSYDIVRQMAITSIDYERDINEFDKSGLTPIASDLVAPPRVGESKVSMECRVNDILPLGDKGGAGHLIICEIIRIHLQDAILDEDGRIDPDKIDLVGRLGRAFYTRAQGDAVFKLFQPFHIKGVGFDQLPESIVRSTVLTGNEIAEIAALAALPEILPENRTYIQDKSPKDVHLQAKELIIQGDTLEAARLLLALDASEKD
jgi:flavin reductase (DIM6/NTAB) family NADH-FMN oxidoreductase RutF